jgi:hypothetical protein
LRNEVTRNRFTHAAAQIEDAPAWWHKAGKPIEPRFFKQIAAAVGIVSLRVPLVEADDIGGRLIAGAPFLVCSRAQRGAMRIAPSRRTSSPLR